jgi:hypothetical protein
MEEGEKATSALPQNPGGPKSTALLLLRITVDFPMSLRKLDPHSAVFAGGKNCRFRKLFRKEPLSPDFPYVLLYQ